ncbi:MAG: trehalose-6-phosphate synthase [Gammaproteobacteria bacterium]|nr:trehalose-6-phosphate synthase [Gammaproteobacteria bacterium]NNF49520.1 trehalose-6-phosphate synthase [Woeseiaceae bacterium]MBT8093162.1 trehalose-6-phosphate synthase [Gammaproteobacteria bacterium]MBT8104001.1 trehalose-6-phosphate synthase [Gammaproteobacteria bacterium]NNK24016.1 trehalose-6-phosphate synthase [Woeseiaceae bacterium]
MPKAGGVPGGLAVGVLGALREHGGMWFGWSGELTNGSASDPEIIRRGNVEYATISLNEQDFEQYYNGYSNKVLWPVCHYLLDFIRYYADDFEGYRRVNSIFATKLKSLLKPDDLIWVHDYHLIPLAAELRSAGIENPIGFFLHVPFPSYEALRAIPGHEYLLRCMCAYDVIGFHTTGDLAAFQTCVREPIVGAEFLDKNRIKVPGGELIADVFPIGIDVDEVQQLAEEAQKLRQVQNMVKSLGGRELLIGVDRLDYSKGLTQRFLAYERLLEKYPNAQKVVTLMQIAPPTRTGVRAYDDIREELEQTSGRINGRFAETNWVPIRYLNKGVARKPLMGFFRNASVALVTPVRDGMNLVAKEFVAAQDPDDPGMVVLSSLTGAAQELTDAVIVNPYDRDDVADGIATAISMSIEERRERYESMMAILRKNDITAWRTRFVDALLNEE